MDYKLEARLEKIENRLDALWRSTIQNSLESGDKLSNDCSITFKEENSIMGYGFNQYGKWESDDKEYSWGSGKNLVLASEEEVKEALIKEAVKRGFKHGVVFDSLSTFETERDNNVLMNTDFIEAYYN